ncbi:hypothetical protein DB41_IP00210 [Neochlamydia sp. TUME1]|nr:hypothetical protein DB41_IP00210 [Neochlamydia sp. TUME1]
MNLLSFYQKARVSGYLLKSILDSSYEEDRNQAEGLSRINLSVLKGVQ